MEQASGLRILLGMVSLFVLTSCAKKVDENAGAWLKNGDEVRVAEVLKGDEVVVEQGKTKHIVRMLGIDAFRNFVMNEDITAMHEKAKLFLADLVVGKNVKLVFDTPTKDEHDRYLAYLMKDDMDINQVMLGEGFVPVYNKFKFARESEYIQTEKSAREAKKKIWGIERLSNLVLERRSLWSEFRAEKEGPLPAYYKTEEIATDPAMPTEPAENPTKLDPAKDPTTQ